MKLEDSPTLSDFTPEQFAKPSRSFGSTKLGLLVIVVVMLMVVGVWVMVSLQAVVTTKMAGKGSITGIVYGQDGLPLSAEIVLLGQGIEAKADLEGRFEIANVPAGPQSVAILYLGSGWEYPVQVKPGETTHLGAIQFVATQEPSY